MMLRNFFRPKRVSSMDSEILLRFAIPSLLSGGVVLALCIGVLVTKAPIVDTFWQALVMSLGIFLCGVGLLVYRWLLNRYGVDDEEN